MASDRLHTFFRIWTLKEAFTKALGLGLGFDFSRLDFDLTTHTLTSDNTPLVGWALSTSDVLVGGETYIGAIARFVGGSGSAVVQDVPALPAWKRTAASEFLINAIDTLHE
jgi:4'-phosphopantetheinyl transferase